MKRAYIASWLVLSVVLASCQSLGLEPAKTFTGRLAYAYSTYTAANNTIASSLDAKRISSDDAKSFRVIAQEARTALDTARTVYESGDIADANNRLTFALSVLERLTAYLDSQGAKS